MKKIEILKIILIFSIVLVLSSCQKKNSKQIIEETLDTSKTEESSEQKVMNKVYGIEDNIIRDTSNGQTSTSTYLSPYSNFNEMEEFSEAIFSAEVLSYEEYKQKRDDEEELNIYSRVFILQIKVEKVVKGNLEPKDIVNVLIYPSDLYDGNIPSFKENNRVLIFASKIDGQLSDCVLVEEEINKIPTYMPSDISTIYKYDKSNSLLLVPDIILNKEGLDFFDEVNKKYLKEFE